MEGNSWGLAEGELSAAANGRSADWRTQLQPKARQMIVNKILETLKRHLPNSGPEDLNQLRNIAARFEERIFTEADNQSEYLRKISLKLLSMESKTQHSASINTSVSNSNNQNSTDPGTLFTIELDSDETSGWSLAEGEISAAASGSSADWRTQLQPKARHMIVNQIHEILKRHLPFPEPVDSNQLQNVAARLEEAIFNAAHNQSEYLRKISLKMLSVESKTQHSASINTSVSNNNNQNPTDPDC
ncbi:mediator of RNA polymerase II transcription subunit 15a-like isoform X1 [Musa acuminata AAA Group]|uniref:mediator of RNA polymerase II transcription subunit 15a-like isoform X1 n=1 Tax=Musa acuminata AAA Group TaxID=214697 RepID=UPI0031DAC27A